MIFICVKASLTDDEIAAIDEAGAKGPPKKWGEGMIPPCARRVLRLVLLRALLLSFLTIILLAAFVWL